MPASAPHQPDAFAEGSRKGADLAVLPGFGEDPDGRIDALPGHVALVGPGGARCVTLSGARAVISRGPDTARTPIGHAARVFGVTTREPG